MTTLTGLFGTKVLTLCLDYLHCSLLILLLLQPECSQTCNECSQTLQTDCRKMTLTVCSGYLRAGLLRQLTFSYKDDIFVSCEGEVGKANIL